MFAFYLLPFLDEKIRGRAVKAVEKFLSLQGDTMGYEEFMKLWKGFFYCFWLSDKTDGQHKLAEIISSFIHQLSCDNKSNPADSAAFMFVRTFWETIGREWMNLDHLRLSKYYYFIGRILFESFKFIASKAESDEWSVDLVKAHNSILSSVVFDFKNQAFPMSIRSYVIENYFPVLKSVREVPFSAEMTVLTCEPIITAVAYCNNKTFFTSFSEALIQGILPGEENEEDFEGGVISGEELEDDSIENIPEEEDEAAEESFDEKEPLESAEDEDFGSEVEDMSGTDDDDGEEEASDDYDGSEEDVSETESSPEFVQSVFDYSKLGKYIFDLGGKEDILVRNRRFLFEFSKIIDQVNCGEVDCCDNDYCCEEAWH